MESSVSKPVREDLIGNVEVFDELAKQIILEVGGTKARRGITQNQTVIYKFSAKENRIPYNVTLTFTGKRIIFAIDSKKALPSSVDIYFETQINKMVYEKEIKYPKVSENA